MITPWDLRCNDQPLWLANVPVMSTLLFQAVRDSVVELLAAPKYLGAQPGIVLHSTPGARPWCASPCAWFGHGWWSDAEQALEGCPPWFLLPARVVMAVFRGKMLDAIRCAWTRGALVVPEGLRPQQVLTLLNRLGHPVLIVRASWSAMRTVSGCRDVSGSLPAGRSHQERAPWGLDGARVTFTCRARHEKADGARPGTQRWCCRLDFLQRWLWHVPVPQTRTVRCYGLYHARRPRRWRCAARRSGTRRWWSRWGWMQTVCAQRGEAHPRRCPTCGQLLVCTGVIPRGRGSSPPASEECAA